MLKELRKKIASFVAHDYVSELKVSRETEINNRVAKIIAQMDPFEPILKEFHGTFSQEYERPEDKLAEKDQIQMYMWGFQQDNDKYFRYMIDWIMDVCANATLKRANVTPERILYGRAELATMLLLKKEVARLSGLYKEIIKRPEDFDKSKTVE